MTEQNTGRRYYEKTQLVQAGGGFEKEWFRIRSQPTAQDIRELNKFEGTNVDQGYYAAFLLLKAWSFTKLSPKNADYDPLADGVEMTDEEIDLHYNREPMEKTLENLMSLPVECSMPLLEAVGAATNFLKQKSESLSDSTSQ